MTNINSMKQRSSIDHTKGNDNHDQLLQHALMNADHANQADTSNHEEISSIGDQSPVTTVRLKYNMHYNVFVFSAISIRSVANGHGW